MAPGRVVSTLTYNGQFPGPLLRFMQGRRTWVDTTRPGANSTVPVAIRSV
ncbi:hypothetical protein MAHJHV55_52700 [Mycobacterium avium subsp. hominissuis]